MFKINRVKQGVFLLVGGMAIGGMILGGIGCGSQTAQEVGVQNAAVTSETSPEVLESSSASPPPEAASTGEMSSAPSSAPTGSPSSGASEPALPSVSAAPDTTASTRPADGSTPAAAPPAQKIEDSAVSPPSEPSSPPVQPAALPAPQEAARSVADGPSLPPPSTNQASQGSPSSGTGGSPPTLATSIDRPIDLPIPLRHELFGLFNDVAEHRFHVVQLQPRTGKTDILASFQFQRMSLPTALSPRKLVFFFVGDHRLHAVHIGTGRVIREIPLPSWVKGVTSLEFDDRGDILYALFNTAEGHKLTAIHTISGRIDIIAHLPVGPVGLNSALDPDRGRYFFASTRGFYAVDTRTGRILVTAPLPQWVRGVTSMDFDKDKKTLYGLLNTASGHVFAKLDPETGGVDIITHLPVDRIGVMNSALDAEGNRYFFAGAGHLYTVDTRTGRVEADVSIPTYIVSLAF